MSRDIKIETSMKVSTIMAQAPGNCVNGKLPVPTLEIGNMR